MRRGFSAFRSLLLAQGGLLSLFRRRAK